MKPNFSNMYNSLTPTSNHSAPPPLLAPSPPPPFLASALPKYPPPLPPPLVISKSAPLIRDYATPAPSFDPPPRLRVLFLPCLFQVLLIAIVLTNFYSQSPPLLRLNTKKGPNFGLLVARPGLIPKDLIRLLFFFLGSVRN